VGKMTMLTDRPNPVYLAKFSAEGKPEGFLLEGVNYKTPEEKQAKIAEGYNVQLTQEEWEYYTNNRGMGDNGTGYIRDPETGKPVSAPPIVYTKAELANMAASKYEAIMKDYDNQIMQASFKQDDELVQELMDEKQEYVDEYNQILTDIENGVITKPDQMNNEEEAQ
jgi:hypothetical protein